MQPVAATSARLLRQTPNRRIEFRYSFHTRYGQVQRPARAFVTITNVSAVRALHPCLYTPPLDTFNACKGIAMKGEPPGDGLSNVGPRGGPLHAHYGIRQCRRIQATQRRPQKWRRRDEPPTQVSPGDLQGVADQHGRASES